MAPKGICTCCDEPAEVLSVQTRETGACKCCWRDQRLCPSCLDYASRKGCLWGWHPEA